MRKSEFEKYKSRLIPRLSEVYRARGEKPVVKEKPFATITIRHVNLLATRDQYIDAPRWILQPPRWNIKRLPGQDTQLPLQVSQRRMTRSKFVGRRRYYKFENNRLERMVASLMEEVVDNEVALRAGELPLVEWRPGEGVRWTKKLTQALLDHIANGGTYLSFATRVGISRAAVVEFAKREDIAPLVAQAAQYGVDAMAEAALEVAGRPCMVEEVIETVTPDGTVLQKNVRRRDQVEARKLAYESRMRYLAKIAPNRYGDKPEVQELSLIHI